MRQHMQLTIAAALALGLGVALHIGLSAHRPQSSNGYVQMYQRDVNECEERRETRDEVACSAEALDRIERLPFQSRTAARAAVDTYLKSGR